MNLADPELELLDPTPNVYNLFIQFDNIFFWTKLASRAVVSWSKRMYSCAGVCSYEGNGGLCKISLSEPLLKLRPRKDLVETLLHEMIHAFLFITNRDRDRDGHGPNFQAHMHRINKAAGLNISIYHDFHDEVKLYQTHWWRCNGPCQKMRPYFGIVKRSMNRAPGPSDFWWNDHTRRCGGTFIKIKEPEKKGKKGAKTSQNNPNMDISKYITIQKTVNNLPGNVHTIKSVLKDSNEIQNSNSNGTTTVKKTQPVAAPGPQLVKPAAFTSPGQTVGGGIKRASTGVAETVRNVWANKQLPGTVSNGFVASNTKNTNKQIQRTSNNNKQSNTNKQKADTPLANPPPMKVKKIDDYFKTAETLLKDVYGQDFNVTQTSNNRLVATAVPSSNKDLVPCPICNTKINSSMINRHLDECLNKDLIKSFSNEVLDNVYNESKVFAKTASERVPVTTNIKDLVAEVDSRNNINNKFAEISKMNKVKNDLVRSNGMQLIRHSLPKDEKSKVSPINPLTVQKPGQLANKDVKVPIIHKPIVVKEEQKEPVKVAIHKPILTKSEQIEPVKIPIIHKPIEIKSEPAIEVFEPLFQLEPNTNKVTVRKSDSFVPKENEVDTVIKIEPGTSGVKGQKCACCFKIIDKPMREHFDECVAFTNSPDAASTSVIVIDDADELDETLTMNATGTKLPCPCCLRMVEEVDMNRHLDKCLC